MAKNGGGIFKSKWAKVLLGAFGAMGLTTVIGHFTGFNNMLIAPAIGFMIGGPIVAIASLLVPMLTGQGNGLSLLGLTGQPTQKTTQVGTVYT